MTWRVCCTPWRQTWARQSVNTSPSAASRRACGPCASVQAGVGSARDRLSQHGRWAAARPAAVRHCRLGAPGWCAPPPHAAAPARSSLRRQPGPSTLAKRPFLSSRPRRPAAEAHVTAGAVQLRPARGTRRAPIRAPLCWRWAAIALSGTRGARSPSHRSPLLPDRRTHHSELMLLCSGPLRPAAPHALLHCCSHPPLMCPRVHHGPNPASPRR